MSKTSWSLLIFGILAAFFVSCKDDEEEDSTGTTYLTVSTVFRCDGPLTADCTGETPITEYSQVRIFYDGNRNGPDEQDYCPIPPGYISVPEAWFANFADFYFNGESFTSPVFRCGSGLETFYNAFYLRAYAGDNGNIVWTSPKFSLIPHTGAPDTVDLPFSEWTCEIAESDPPQCMFVPGWFLFNVEDEFECIETCDGAEVTMYFYHLDSIQADRIPILQIAGSCDDTPDGEVAFLPAAWQDEGAGTWALREFTGQRYGKVTISWLDSVPCANLDTLSVTRTDSNSIVAWHSTFEQNCANYEVWFLGLPNQYGTPTLLGEIAATNFAEGADYVFYAPRLNAGYSFQFTIVAVDDDGNKYPCKRIVSSS